MTSQAQPKQSVEVALAVLAETVRNMDKKLDEIARDKADKLEVTAIERRTTKLENHLGWTVKCVIAAVIAAVLGGGYLVSKQTEPRHPAPIIQQYQPPAPR